MREVHGLGHGKASMDNANQWKTAATPSLDGNDDALARQLIENWARPASHRNRSTKIMQRLRDGRVRVVEVESKRSRRYALSRN
jgi:hypothetical protein